MKILIELKVTPKGTTALADEIHGLLPSLDFLNHRIESTRALVGTAKYRMVDNQSQSSYITFENESR